MAHLDLNLGTAGRRFSLSRVGNDGLTRKQRNRLAAEYDAAEGALPTKVDMDRTREQLAARRRANH